SAGRASATGCVCRRLARRTGLRGFVRAPCVPRGRRSRTVRGPQPRLRRTDGSPAPRHLADVIDPCPRYAHPRSRTPVVEITVVLQEMNDAVEVLEPQTELRAERRAGDLLLAASPGTRVYRKQHPVSLLLFGPFR